MIKISRLKKVAAVENLDEKNMSTMVLNNILQETNTDATVSSILFRKMMNSNTRYIVEIWQLNNSRFAVFSGYFEGDWNVDNVTFNGVFEDQTAAELYVQENLQDEAESKENLLAPDQKEPEETEDKITASMKKKDLRKRLS
ncbi:hypothetical protein D3C75_731420 [compost metagenome]